MAVRYHMTAVVIVTMIGALVTAPWGVNKELAERTSLLRHVIYLYLNRPLDQALDAPRLALLRFIYSDQGQRTVAKRGYTPLPASITLQALRELSR